MSEVGFVRAVVNGRRCHWRGVLDIGIRHSAVFWTWSPYLQSSKGSQNFNNVRSLLWMTHLFVATDQNRSLDSLKRRVKISPPVQEILSTALLSVQCGPHRSPFVLTLCPNKKSRLNQVAHVMKHGRRHSRQQIAGKNLSRS